MLNSGGRTPELDAVLALDDPIGRCMMPGVPRTTGMPMPIQFVQGPKQFIILYEAYHAFRVIPFDAKHPSDIEPSFMGDSVAHWM